MFHTLDRGGVSAFLGDEPPSRLADAMCDAWWHFARTGSPTHDGVPGWTEWSSTAPLAYELGSHLVGPSPET